MSKESRAIAVRPMGIETEFGVFRKSNGVWIDGNADFIEGFRKDWLPGTLQPEWDPRARLDGNPSDGGDHECFQSVTWRRMKNYLLPNGSRMYLDGSHAEVSSALCHGALQTVRWNRACYRMIDRIRAEHLARNGNVFKVYRNNTAVSDTASEYPYHARGNRHVSYACHVNVCVQRRVAIEELIAAFGEFLFPALIPVCGAGKAGAHSDRPTVYQMSQRADFMFRLADHETMHCRPIYNTRDVPYADPDRFRRMHGIYFDSNMLVTPEFLKMALVDIGAKMLEDGVFPRYLRFRHPIDAGSIISGDLSFRALYDTEGRAKRTPLLDLLKAYRDASAEYLSAYYPHDSEAQLAMERFSYILEALDAGRHEDCIGLVDWITKREIVGRLLSRRGRNWESDAARMYDAEYHNNDHEKGIFFLYEQKAAVGASACADAVAARDRILLNGEMDACSRPPETRSHIVYEYMKAYGNRVSFSNYWNEIAVHFPGNPETQYLLFQDPTEAWPDAYVHGVCALPMEECTRVLVRDRRCDIKTFAQLPRCPLQAEDIPLHIRMRRPAEDADTLP